MVVGVAAHTIGHREITIIDNSSTGDNNNDNNSYDASIYDTVSVSSGNLSSVETGTGVYSSNNSGAESDNIRQLIVVSVRGSVSLMAWAIDLTNQINLEYLNFETGYQSGDGSLIDYGVGICNYFVTICNHFVTSFLAKYVL